MRKRKKPHQDEREEQEGGIKKKWRAGKEKKQESVSDQWDKSVDPSDRFSQPAGSTGAPQQRTFDPVAQR